MADIVKARLVAAFDASGKEDQPCIVVAGFLASHSDWQAFHTAWTERLGKDGIGYFHMVDFAACRKQFEGWSLQEPRRQQLYGDLIGIIQSHVYRQFACVVENQQFGRISAVNRQEYRLNAYTLACRTCAADVRRWCSKSDFGDTPTGFAFEDGDIGKGMLTQRFREDGLPDPTFLPKKDMRKPDGTNIAGYTPLQAADILGWELNKPYRDMLAGKPRIERFRWGFEQLGQIPGIPGHYSIKDLEAVNRKLQDLHEEKLIIRTD
jgi:hypothetical protein